MNTKKYSFYIMVLALVSFSITGCKKFLETKPDNRTDLNSVDKVKALLVNAYTQANYIDFLEMATDNADDKGPLAQSVTIDGVNTEPYKFNDETSETGRDSPIYFWNKSWEAISAANHALRAIENMSEEPNADEYLPFKGEALVARAYAHFMLVTIFAHVYEPETADEFPGIPYVTEPGTTVQEQYDRKTVAYVYDQIEKDLDEGIPLLSSSVYDVPKFHFTPQAAHAFAARFYLFKQDYEKVVEHANKVYPGGRFKGNLRPWIDVYNNWSTAEMRVNYSRAQDPANLLIQSVRSGWARYYYRYRFGLTSSMLNDVFKGENVTGASWGQRTSSYNSSTNMRMNKFDSYFEYSTANTGKDYTRLPLLSAEEALFNRAEANINLGNYDDAIADLNLYASQRISGYDESRYGVTFEKINDFYGISDQKEGLMQTLLDFKKAEFIQEGLRWFDIIRHKITVTHKVLDEFGDVAETIVVPDGDPRRVFQMPPEVKLAGMEQNPR